MKRFFISACMAIALTSCATPMYYQMYSVASESAQYSSNGSPIFKTDDGLEFTYNFWGESGNLRFIVYNNNDYDVIIDMTRSAFIRNNIAEDYFTDKEIESRIATGVFTSSQYGVSTSINRSIGVGTLDNYLGRTYDVALALGVSESKKVEVGTTLKKEWQTAVVYKEPKSVRVPAKSAKAFLSFNINNCLITAPSLKAKAYYRPITFTKDNSPLIMRNRICVYKDGDEPTFHNMDFYIDKIGNLYELSLIKPTLFYISYPSSIEQEEYFTNDLLSLEKGSTSSQSLAKNNGINVGNNKSITVGDSIEYKSVSTTIISVIGTQVVLAASGFKSTWDEAIAYCESLGKGWRLPSVAELNKINRSHLTYEYYWTIEETNEKRAKYYDALAFDSYVANKTKSFYVQPIAIVDISELNQ